jgi:hypothetical protein
VQSTFAVPQRRGGGSNCCSPQERYKRFIGDFSRVKKQAIFSGRSLPGYPG